MALRRGGHVGKTALSETAGYTVAPLHGQSGNIGVEQERECRKVDGFIAGEFGQQ